MKAYKTVNHYIHEDGVTEIPIEIRHGGKAYVVGDMSNGDLVIRVSTKLHTNLKAAMEYAKERYNEIYGEPTHDDIHQAVCAERDRLREALKKIRHFANNVDTESYGDGFYLAVAEEALQETE